MFLYGWNITIRSMEPSMLNVCAILLFFAILTTIALDFKELIGILIVGPSFILNFTYFLKKWTTLFSFFKKALTEKNLHDLGLGRLEHCLISEFQLTYFLCVL